MSTNLLALWRFRSKPETTTIILPDGCRDLIMKAVNGEKPKWFVCPVFDQAKIISIEANSVLYLKINGEIMKKNLIHMALLLVSSNAIAGSVTGNVNMLEVWSNGNVAFTLSTIVNECNGQFVLNHSSNGSKNIYSALLAAKISGKQVSISYSDTCGIAENYNAAQYNIPSYLYSKDN